MTDTAKTTTFVGVALALVLVAYIAQPKSSRDAAVFDDTREPFYPDLTDPSVPTAMDVVEFNEKLGTQNPFRVQYKDGRWTIPSHHDYPADAEDRLKKTAGAIIGLRKDSIVSNSKADFAALGVVDPLATQSDTTGWGTRVKLSNKDGNVVSDLIFGKDVPDKPGFKYVRVPDKERTYAVEVKDLSLSIKFSDWIDTDLIAASASDFADITIKDYSVNPQLGTIDNKGTTVLQKDAAGSQWVVEGVGEKEETNQTKAQEVVNSIADLKVVGVRVKPPGLKPDLSVPEGVQQALNMQDRGFYLLKTGEVVSNDGEAIAETKDGLVYTLRFGGMILGTGDEVTAGKDDEKAEKEAEKKEAPAKEGEEKAEEKADVQENRFMLLSVAFDESKFPPIPDLPPVEPPAEEKKEEKADPTSAQQEEKAAPVAEEKPAEPAVEEKPDASPAEEKPAATPVEEKPAVPKAEEPKAEDKPATEEPKAEEKTAEEKAADAAKDASTKEAEAKVRETERKMQEEELKRKREERDRKIKEGQEKAKELSDRYARWYYVVPNDSVKKIRAARAELIQEKKPAGAEGTPGAGGIPGHPSGIPGLPGGAIPGLPGGDPASETPIVPAPPKTDEPANPPAAEEKPAAPVEEKTEEKTAEEKAADEKVAPPAESVDKAADTPAAEPPAAEPKAETP